MNAFRLNPMLVENTVLSKSHLNGFEIKCLSQTTDMTETLQKQLIELVAFVEEEQMCFSNLHVEMKVVAFNTVEFLIGAKEIYDSSDEEKALTWLPDIIKALTNAKAFAP